MSNTRVNIYGYPLRLGERECSYYLKTGQCKFGVTCKFNHPQPGGMSMLEPAHQFYPTVQSSSSVPLFDPYGAVSPSYRTGRPPPLPGSYVPGAYGPMLLSPGVVPISGWSPYVGPVSPVLSPSAPYSVGAGSVYGVTQLPSSASAFAGPYPTFPCLAGPSSSAQERGFPERPGQPDCQYYLKTGDCKFGSSCRFHHPPDWVVSKTNCLLSPMGLPMCPVCWRILTNSGLLRCFVQVLGCLELSFLCDCVALVCLMEQMARLQTQQKQSWLQFLSLVLLVKSEREVHFHDGAHTIQAARNFLIQRYGGHKPSVDAIKSAHDGALTRRYLCKFCMV